MIDVFVDKIAGLGNRSYLATDGSVGIVVDPPRDVDRTIALAGRHGVEIRLVLDTHVHNDYVSGGLELARTTGARYVLAAGETVDFAASRIGVLDGDVLDAGTMRIRAIHTPGHTDHHFAYVLSDTTKKGRVAALFSGGSWLQGTAGRTDLVGAENTDRLARAQWRSLRRLAEMVPDHVSLLPTHGFGSFCAPGAFVSIANPTVGSERARHPALTQPEDTFVEMLTSGFSAYPRYYARMAPINRRGPDPIDLMPPAEAGSDELSRRIAAGDWVVDLRARDRFAAAHIEGSINVESGDAFATYLGWLLPHGTPLALIGESPQQVAAAQRALARIGIDRPIARATGKFDEWRNAAPTSTYRIASFADLATARADGDAVMLLDVRADDEWRAGHLPGARHCPIGELHERLEEVVSWANGATIWVYCAAGFRASIAASILDRRGVSVVLINGSWHEAEVLS
jgi:glyoxylase-like metal-dependent hydrolase (beta-lactamase superfamily II)/rhodanese-related sulfurtransferase